MGAFFNLIFYFSKEGFFKNVRLKINVLKVKSNIGIFFLLLLLSQHYSNFLILFLNVSFYRYVFFRNKTFPIAYIIAFLSILMFISI